MNFTKDVGSRSDFLNIKSLPHLGMSLEKEATKSSKICTVDSLQCAMKSLYQIEHNSKPAIKHITICTARKLRSLLSTELLNTGFTITL